MKKWREGLAWNIFIVLVTLFGFILVMGAYQMVFAHPLADHLPAPGLVGIADYSPDLLTVYIPPLNAEIIKQAEQDFESIQKLQEGGAEEDQMPDEPVAPIQPTDTPLVPTATEAQADNQPTPTEVVATQIPTETQPPSSTPTATSVVFPTATATLYQPPTDTPRPTRRKPTNTPVPPTNTPIPPTDTPLPTNTPQPTNTPRPPTNTPLPTNPYPGPTDPYP